MLIRREALAAVLPATTSDDTRYALLKAQIRPDGSAAATDGIVAIIATPKGTLPDEDFPTIAGAPFHGSPSTPFLLDPATIKRLIGATQKGKRNQIPVLATIQVSTNGSDSAFTLAATDLASPMVTTICVDASEHFPVIERVIPEADKRGTVPVIFAVDVLEALIKSAKAVHGNKPKVPHLRFEIPCGRKDRYINGAQIGEVSAPIRVTSSGDEVDILAVAMPCRSGAAPR